MTETRCPIYYRDGELSCQPEHVKIAAVHSTVAVVTGDARPLHCTYTTLLLFGSGKIFVTESSFE
jgi:hypothetical protein